MPLAENGRLRDQVYSRSDAARSCEKCTWLTLRRRAGSVVRVTNVERLEILFAHCLPVGGPKLNMNEFFKFSVISDGALVPYKGVTNRAGAYKN